MTDPIADMLIRIKNAQAVLHPSVEIPHSKLKYKLANILLESNFITSVEKKRNKINKIIKIGLKYDKKEPVIEELRRVSKPGRRIYTEAKKIRSPRGGRGMVIVSTPKGLMAGEEARKKNLGGEIICELW
ncbi:MAG: 30S ribosomal protein S8 [Patescibacteria group bacterium]|nr:30S ribosomal protein S8 [Patescibacteria group bacterium]